MTTAYRLHPRQKEQPLVDTIHEVRIDSPSKKAFQSLAKAQRLSMRAALTQLIEQHAEIRECFHLAVRDLGRALHPLSVVFTTQAFRGGGVNVCEHGPADRRQSRRHKADRGRPAVGMAVRAGERVSKTASAKLAAKAVFCDQRSKATGGPTDAAALGSLLRHTPGAAVLSHIAASWEEQRPCATSPETHYFDSVR